MRSMRATVPFVLTLVWLSALLSMNAATHAESEVVRVDGGEIGGAVDRGVRVFKGIPFAAPPVGELRWKPPQPVRPWTGVRDASQFGAECPQTQYPSSSVYVHPLQPQGEDCLFLNVWTTAKANERQPVFVWVHGGALTRGSSISDIRDGVPLARKGVVLVSLNYRLGALGYLAHPALSAESPHRSSGNYGVLDQIAALQWVQKNIAAFGGDPSRVSIGGESAGSWSVNALVASPLAKGLFIRAIGQSGGRFSRTPHLTEDRGSQQSAENAGRAFANALAADSASALRVLPVERVIAQAIRTQENVDGWVLPDEIRTLFADRKHNNVPVIVGSNADEMTSLGGGGNAPTTMEEFRKRLAQQYGEHAAAFETAYGVKSEADIATALLAVGRDTTFSSHMRSWARMTAAAGSPAYLYFFTYAPPHPRARELRAFHASELPYVFNVVPSSDPREQGFSYTDRDRTLANAMSDYWVNFIKTGNPNGKGLPQWPAYSADSEPYLEFGSTIKAGQHLLKRELDFLETALARR
jgi:para-nitrobenzyl esterase